MAPKAIKATPNNLQTNEQQKVDYVLSGDQHI